MIPNHNTKNVDYHASIINCVPCSWQLRASCAGARGALASKPKGAPCAKPTRFARRVIFRTRRNADLLRVAISEFILFSSQNNRI